MPPRSARRRRDSPQDPSQPLLRLVAPALVRQHLGDVQGAVRGVDRVAELLLDLHHALVSCDRVTPSPLEVRDGAQARCARCAGADVTQILVDLDRSLEMRARLLHPPELQQRPVHDGYEGVRQRLAIAGGLRLLDGFALSRTASAARPWICRAAAMDTVALARSSAAACGSSVPSRPTAPAGPAARRGPNDPRARRCMPRAAASELAPVDRRSAACAPRRTHRARRRAPQLGRAPHRALRSPPRSRTPGRRRAPLLRAASSARR